MQRFCGSMPCFLTNESKIEANIPLIYQNPQQFYFPHQLDNPSRSRNAKKVKKYDFANENQPYIMDQNLKRVKSQANSHLGMSQHMSLSNNASTIAQKQDCYPREPKQNRNSRVNGVSINHKPTNIYFDSQLYRSKSSEKVLTTALKTNESNHNFTQIHPQKYPSSKNGQFDIVPISQYHSLIQNNHQMKRIIEKEYRPLKNSYEHLIQQQKDRQKLIMLLQHKVKQLGQKLKQRSVNTMNYVSY